MKIDIITAVNSWLDPFLTNIIEKSTTMGHCVSKVNDSYKLNGGDLLFILGYDKKLQSSIVDKYSLSIVIHESALPDGKGNSPMSWQLLDNKKSITVCAIVADNKIDSGDILYEDHIKLDGTETYKEWRNLQGNKTVEITLQIIKQYPNLKMKPQCGKESYYRKRNFADDEVLPENSILEVFDKLRICNPDKYPVWFKFRGRKYKLILEPFNA